MPCLIASCVFLNIHQFAVYVKLPGIHLVDPKDRPGKLSPSRAYKAGKPDDFPFPQGKN